MIDQLDQAVDLGVQRAQRLTQTSGLARLIVAIMLLVRRLQRVEDRARRQLLRLGGQLVDECIERRQYQWCR